MPGKATRNKHFFLAVAIPTALSYWLLDSCIHYFAYGEFEFEVIPSDFNELWMRTMILVLLVGFGIFADHHANALIKKDAERRDVYMAMLGATQHILNNFLQSMVLFQDMADESDDFDQETIDIIDQTIRDTATQIENLKNIQDPTKESIRKRFLCEHSTG